MTESRSPERGATRLIFLMCGMAQSSWAPVVPLWAVMPANASFNVPRPPSFWGCRLSLWLGRQPLLLWRFFCSGASIGAIDVVMNVQASLVERKSGENLMSGFIHSIASAALRMHR
jgi:hypothetical protein